jgi:hypothetical protein
MAKSRVEKNKALYEELELESFELEDISETKKETIKEEKVEAKVEEKKQEIVKVEEKKQEVAVIEEKKEETIEDDFVVEQPISYTSKLSVEEILRAKLEKQQQLKDSKKGYKKSPFTESYTPEMMQKNISQEDGIDIRKEANIKMKKENNAIVWLLVFLLFAIIGAGIAIAFVIL